MCGILGSFTKEKSLWSEVEHKNALSKLNHRGPDSFGMESINIADGNLTLGHTRLSIIDLTLSGHQPMTSENGRYTIIFNGEIYNYIEIRKKLKVHNVTFQGDSDTEVLLSSWAYWGIDCLKYLVGMFAFAILDRRECKVTLVRDGFGIKPLFYCIYNGNLIFSSEIPSILQLLKSRPNVNHGRAYAYLVCGEYDNGIETFYDNIYTMLPGHFLQVSLDSIQEAVFDSQKRWWWPSIKCRNNKLFSDAVDEFRTLFLSNIRLHLRSDVELGATLSGGIDSSAVVCAIRYLEPEMPINTFSFVARGSSASEESWVDIVNQHVGAISHKVIIGPDELATDLTDMITAQAEPFVSTSIYAQYRVFKMASAEGIKVTLDGQGADELLAGYTGYPQEYMLSLKDHAAYHKIPLYSFAWSQWPGRRKKDALLLMLSTLLPGGYQSQLHKYLANDLSVINVINHDWAKNRKDELSNRLLSIRNNDSDANGRRLVNRLRDALTSDGLPALLRHGDRNSMRWSVESRVPFLTTDMAEYVLSLPESYLVSDKGETKRILRAALRGIVPDQILDRRDKIGFQTPEFEWMQLIEDKIVAWVEGAESISWLDPEQCRKEVLNTISGKTPYTSGIWRLLNFCRWLQVMDVHG